MGKANGTKGLGIPLLIGGSLLLLLLLLLLGRIVVRDTTHILEHGWTHSIAYGKESK